jgi:transcriptional regulator with XRE-family HTH domain
VYNSLEVISMDTLGGRLKHARKNKGFTQDSLAETIGVSRGVIFNLEKNKTEPQTIVINAICQTLNINKDWLMNGSGEMENTARINQRAKILTELYEVIKGLSEDEQLYLLDTIKALKTRLGGESK